MEDKKIVCNFIGCGEEFIHSGRDQEFYAEKKYVDPKYCKFHREQRKADKERKERENNSAFKPALETIRRSGHEYVDNYGLNEQDDFSGVSQVGNR